VPSTGFFILVKAKLTISNELRSGTNSFGNFCIAFGLVSATLLAAVVVSCVLLILNDINPKLCGRDLALENAEHAI